MTITKRRLVVEHDIEPLDGKEGIFPAVIIDGKNWGEDFDYFCGETGTTWENVGQDPKTGRPVSYKQTFLITELTDEQLKAIFI
jgi:hypothetical protein